MMPTAYKRVLLLWALFAVLAWAGCGGKTTPQPTATPAPMPTPTPLATVAPSPTPVPTVPCMASRPGVSPAREAMEYLTAYDHVRGDRERASVFLVVYSDFQCTPCATAARILRAVQKAHSDDVVLVFRHFPLINIHDKAALAAQAAEAAARQGKFWEMHDLLFAEQTRWVGMDGDAFQHYLKDAAERLGLNAEQFLADMNSPEIQSIVQSAWANGINHNLPAVPLLYVNAQLYTGPLNFDDLDAVVRLNILAARQFHACPPVQVSPNEEISAVIATNRGKITLRLYPDKAPNAVNSFVFLAGQGWYDHNRIWRDDEGRWVRSGDPSNTGYGNAGYTFALESAPGLAFDRAGQLALYSAGGDSNSSQFFITLKPLPALNGHATIFGSVVSGMDVLQSLTTGDYIIGVEILRQP